MEGDIDHAHSCVALAVNASAAMSGVRGVMEWWSVDECGFAGSTSPLLQHCEASLHGPCRREPRPRWV